MVIASRTGAECCAGGVVMADEFAFEVKRGEPPELSLVIYAAITPTMMDRVRPE
jgi:hypothetical protein